MIVYRFCGENGATELPAVGGVRAIGIRQVDAAAQAVRRVPRQVWIFGVAHHPIAQAFRGGRPTLPLHHQGADASGHRTRGLPRARRLLQQYVWHQVSLGCVCRSRQMRLTCLPYFSLKAVQNVQKSGKICVLDIDMQGVIQIKNVPALKLVGVFIKPPSIGELERRLRRRNSESEDNLRARLNVAQQEINYGKYMPFLRNNYRCLLKKYIFICTPTYLTRHIFHTFSRRYARKF